MQHQLMKSFKGPLKTPSACWKLWNPKTEMCEMEEAVLNTCRFLF